MSALSTHHHTITRDYAERYPHEDGCTETYCSTCGCCIHCTDCECEGCTNHACGCWVWRGEPPVLCEELYGPNRLTCTEYVGHDGDHGQPERMSP